MFWPFAALEDGQAGSAAPQAIAAGANEGRGRVAILVGRREGARRHYQVGTCGALKARQHGIVHAPGRHPGQRVTTGPPAPSAARMVRSRSTAGGDFRHRLHEVIFEADTPAGKVFDLALFGCIVASVVAVTLESVPAIGAAYRTPLHAVEWFFTVLFTVEYGLRLYCAPWCSGAPAGTSARIEVISRGESQDGTATYRVRA